VNLYIYVYFYTCKHIRSSFSPLSCSLLLHPYHIFSSPPILVPFMIFAGHLDDQEEVPDFTSCMFCGDHDSKWNEDALDLHYWKVQCVCLCVYVCDENIFWFSMHTKRFLMLLSFPPTAPLILSPILPTLHPTFFSTITSSYLLNRAPSLPNDTHRTAHSLHPVQPALK
jgi:hypothetical protein